MNIENQVCSLELAKRLKELGIKQDSLFFYTLGGVASRLEALPILHSNYSAFTVAELGEMLPDCIDCNKLLKNKNTTLLDLNGHFIKSSKKDNEYKIYIDGLTKLTIFFSENEANTRAKMLIYLIENGLIEDKLIFVPENAASLVLGDQNEKHNP